MIEAFRSRYNIPTPLQENHWASMPSDHLHLETHDVLTGVGFERKSSGSSGLIRHRYEHPEKYDMEWVHDRWTPEEADAGGVPPVHPGDFNNPEVHEKLQSLGWRRNRSADFSFDHGDQGHDGIVYDHPNGSRLVRRQVEDDAADGSVSMHAEFHHPRER